MRAGTVIRVVATVVLGLVASGCATSEGPAEASGPLARLSPCEDPPEAIQLVNAIPGLHVPEGSRVTSVGTTGDVTQVQGWVPLTPVQVRQVMTDRDSLQVLEAEDEIWESETVLSDGEHRTFLTAQAVCPTESVFIALVSAE